MHWTQVVLPLILGLVVISWQSVHAKESFIPKGKNLSAAVKPGNKTHLGVLSSIGENFLYTQFACRDKPNGLRLPVAGSCVDYYECQGGATRRLKCKVGLQFSANALACVDARLLKCQPEQMVGTAYCEGPCCGRDDGLYPVKDSCSDYHICINGQVFQKSCGKFLQFSAANLICDIPDRARCSAEIEKYIVDEQNQPESGPSKPTMYLVSNRVCRTHPNGYNIPIFGSCNKFYLCVNGVGFLKSCGNMQFNPGQRYCDTKTRIFCPAIEEDDVILDKEEYAEVDVRPMPLPLPLPIKPIPLKPGEADQQVEYNWPLFGKQPQRPNLEVAGPISRPQNGKKPIQDDKNKTKNRPQGGKKPKPPVVLEEEEEEEEDYMPQWGKKPSHRPQTIEESESDEVPTFRPVKKPQGGKKGSVPVPPIADNIPAPSYLDMPNKEDDATATANSNICADEPVGALVAMPGDCAKYIRCRWDWFERRAAEVMICPEGMHFNAKFKYCDRPENAGCITNSKKTNVTKKKNSFSKF